MAEDANGLHSSEIWRLSRSLQIASVLGDAPPEAALVADRIAQSLGDKQCITLDNDPAWEAAILWAVGQSSLETAVPDFRNGKWDARQQNVGEACVRLRQQGYEVIVGAYGPNLSNSSCEAIHAKVDRLIALVGGAEVIARICHIMKTNNLLHDGMWLFGDQVPGVHQTKSPTLPYGWLFSLGARHIGGVTNPRRPEVAWKSLVALATDYAACLDCQRYNQFEEMNIHPRQIYRVLRDSLVWREVFTLPQVPPLVMTQIEAALNDVLSPDDKSKIGVSLVGLFAEIKSLLANAADDRPVARPSDAAQRLVPNLWQRARGARGQVNASYLDPSKPSLRNLDALLIFERGAQQVLLLPRAMIAAAACELIFRLIWEKLDKSRAAAVVGSTLEHVLFRACKDSAPVVLSNISYKDGKRTFELDIATQDSQSVVFVETKAKSLTTQSRSGDLLAFLTDYSNSFLALVEQLARHERNFKSGLFKVGDNASTPQDINVTKVAVSPLSYGPMTDKVLAGTLLQSLSRASFRVAEVNNPSAEKAVEKINSAVRNVFEEIAKTAPNRDGAIDLRAYMFNVFWLDLGQVLYVLNRSYSASNAFAPLKHITFSTRDFWTEVAFADRGGLTKDRWRPVGLPTVTSVS